MFKSHVLVILLPLYLINSKLFKIFCLSCAYWKHGIFQLMSSHVFFVFTKGGRLNTIIVGIMITNIMIQRIEIYTSNLYESYGFE